MALSNPFGPGSQKGSSIGSGVGGAVGAAAGVAGGPFAPITVPAGTAIGSALGGVVGGAFSSKDETKKVNANFDYARNLPSQGGQNFAHGGALPVTTPEGKLKGPSHEQGGIPLPGGAEAEGGETIDQIDLQSYVFSDRVNVPGTNKTFADVHERMKEKGASERQIKKLAAQQEKTTGRSSNPNSSTSNKMATGGFVDPGPNPSPLAGPGVGKNFSPYYNPVTGKGLTPEANASRNEGSPGTASPSPSPDPSPSGGDGSGMFNQPPTVEEFPFASLGGPSEVPVASPKPVASSPAPGDGAIADIGTNDLAGVNANGNVQGAGGSGGSSGGFDASSAASTAAQFLPAAVNAARGAFGNSDVGEPQLATVSDRNVDTLRRIDTDVDVSDQINAIDQGLRDVITAPGVSEAGRQSAFAKSLKQKRKTLAQARREEQKMKNQKARAVSQAQSRNDKTRTKLNQQARARNRQLQLKADAAKDNMLSKGIGQFSQTMARRQANNQMQSRSTTAIMASLAGMDDATKKKELEAIIPTLPEGPQKQQLQRFLNSL